jgi:hypothetical protein
MRTTVLLLALFAAGLCFGQAAGGDLYGPPPPPPKPLHPEVFVPDKDYTWPKFVLSGEEVEHTFTVENRGGAMLKITNVRTSCGCQTVRYDKSIPPGGKGELVMQIRTRGYRRPTKKSATIMSNDPKNPNYVITMGGDIKAVLVTEPPYPTVEGLRGEILTSTIKIKRQAEGRLEIPSVKLYGNMDMEYEITETKPGEEFELLLKVDSTSATSTSRVYKGQSIRTVINAKLDGKPLEVPMNARMNIVDTVNPATKYVMFQYREVDQMYKTDSAPPVRKITVNGYKGRQFNITNVELAKGTSYYRGGEEMPLELPFTVSVEPGQDKSQWIVSVALQKVPEKFRRSTSREIILHTDDETTPEVRLRASVYFPRTSSLSSKRTPAVRTPAVRRAPRTNVIRPKSGSTPDAGEDTPSTK